MNRLNRYLLLSALILFSLMDSASAQDFNAISISTLGTSSCTGVDIELVAQASGVRQEAYRITSSGDEFDYSSPPLTAPQSTISGAITRSITFPAAAQGGSLIGIAYTIAGAELADKNAAHFFVVYSCAHVTPVFSCSGNGEVCPETIEEYLPRLGRGAYSPRGTFGTIADRNAHYKYLTFCNKGYVGTTIATISVEGRDASAFTLASIDPLPLRLEAGSCASATIVFRTRRIAEFSAALRVHPANPEVKDLSIPLSATTRRLPDLGVDLRSVRIGKLGAAKAILGEVIVSNNGLGKSQKGAKVAVIVSAYLATDKSVPVTVLNVELPALKPGERRTLRFASKRHNFSTQISKIISAKVSGAKRQRGLDTSLSNFADYEYFESNT